VTSDTVPPAADFALGVADNGGGIDPDLGVAGACGEAAADIALGVADNGGGIVPLVSDFGVAILDIAVGVAAGEA
jgi:hypothetical protein